MQSCAKIPGSGRQNTQTNYVQTNTITILMCSITTYMLKCIDGFVSSVTLIGLEIATTVHFIESINIK